VISHIVLHTPGPDDRAFECACHGGLLHNTIRSQQCGADVAGKRTIQPPTTCRCRAPHAASEPGQSAKSTSLWAHSDHCHHDNSTAARLNLLTASPERGSCSRGNSLRVNRSVKVTASRVLTAVRTSRNRAGRWLCGRLLGPHSRFFGCCNEKTRPMLHTEARC
jgi:hypothetical protein